MQIKCVLWNTGLLSLFPFTCLLLLLSGFQRQTLPAWSFSAGDLLSHCQVELLASAWPLCSDLAEGTSVFLYTGLFLTFAREEQQDWDKRGVLKVMTATPTGAGRRDISLLIAHRIKIIIKKNNKKHQSILVGAQSEWVTPNTSEKLILPWLQRETSKEVLLLIQVLKKELLHAPVTLAEHGGVSCLLTIGTEIVLLRAYWMWCWHEQGNHASSLTTAFWFLQKINHGGEMR